ncbi:GH36 C-terminal domain-containing protein [Streptomyces sp. NPDC047123]|uniref:GH36 C-terminal domain-containing protein n=1 Tax=Streptomyces sp. NPDC047123 TaxID=3155622 RepID=UPI00340A95BF
MRDLLDRLRAAHPAVTFASGPDAGARADPADQLAARHALGRLLPAHELTGWVTDNPAGPLRFRFVSAMAGALGIGGDLARWSGPELAEARDWIELHKEIRPLVRFGDLHRLRPPDGGPSAVQYVYGDTSVVLACLPRRAPGGTPAPVRLRGLDPAAVYLCPDTGEVYRGAVLLHRGLRTGLRGGSGTRRCSGCGGAGGTRCRTVSGGQASGKGPDSDTRGERWGVHLFRVG